MISMPHTANTAVAPCKDPPAKLRIQVTKADSHADGSTVSSSPPALIRTALVGLLFLWVNPARRFFLIDAKILPRPPVICANAAAGD